MKAVALNKCLGEYDDLEVADEIVKNIVKEAVYMKKTKLGTLLFIPTSKDDKGYFTYKIGDKFYNTIWTNKYEELPKPHGIEQLTIYDLI